MKKYRLNEKAWSNKTAWKLVNENWTLCHEIVDYRDGHKCVLCGALSNLQLDHTISRTHKAVFFETDHLNYLCPRHHTAKSFNPASYTSKQVDEVTRKRVGTKRYEELIRQAQRTLPVWRTVAFQEGVKEELLEYLIFLKSVREPNGWKS
jgi:hypothetical protein